MSVIPLSVNEHIATLTIASPPANALSTQILSELDQKLDKIENDSTIKVAILKGEGSFFSAGADIKEFTSLHKASDYESLARKGQKLFDRMEHFHIPIIAAIHGAALGGGLELAMACHIRIVSDNAKLGMPEVNLGIIPGFAGTQRLPQLVGNAKAYELILTGEAISGEEAAAIGLANLAVKEDEVFFTAEKLARKIASKSKPSIMKVMELIPFAKVSTFQEGALKEARSFGEAFGTEDAKEGIQAFIEKRNPQFRDR